MSHLKPVWIRLAVNRHAWDKGKPTPLRWRVFIDPSTEAVLVKRCVIEGRATERNYKTRSLAKHDNRDVIAWIHLYGVITFSKGVAHITLAQPKSRR